MDYSKKGNKPHAPDGQVAAQLMQGIGQCAGAMLDNGAARQARVKAAVPRIKPGSTMGAVDPRCVTPAEDTQENEAGE